MSIADQPNSVVLWHYTSLETLINILKTKQVWASDILYLNDATEYRYGLGIAKKAAEKKAATLDSAKSDVVERNIGKSVQDLDKGLMQQPVFVFSMSEEPDLLSQWRAYCGDSSGCSIGFTPSMFTGLGFGTTVVPCIYDEEDPMAQIVEIIDWALGPHVRTSDITQTVNARIASLVPAIKNPAFREEKEWRVVVQPSHWIDAPRIQYRIRKSMIVPYFPIPIGLKFAGIRIGPTPHPELSRSSVLRLLRTSESEVPATEVKNSVIPYRGW